LHGKELWSGTAIEVNEECAGDENGIKGEKGVPMKSQTLGKIVTTSVLAAILSCGLALGADKPARETAQPAARQKTTKKEMSFKSEQTDSWLCNNVSAFFCTNLFPTLGSSSGSASSQLPDVPDRSRRGGN
jgi:hypothetical protein